MTKVRFAYFYSIDWIIGGGKAISSLTVASLICSSGFCSTVPTVRATTTVRSLAESPSINTRPLFRSSENVFYRNMTINAKLQSLGILFALDYSIRCR